MTKKDYVKIAAALRTIRQDYLEGTGAASIMPDEIFEEVVSSLKRVFRADNPLFDNSRFHDAVYTD